MPDGDKFYWGVKGIGSRRHCDEWCRFPGSLLAQLGRKAA